MLTAASMELEGQPPSSAAQARATFETWCAPCHGPSGGGRYIAPGARPPAIAGIAEAKVLAHVRHGGHAMPAFSPAVLSDDDLSQLATYVHGELAHPAHEPARIGVAMLDPFLVGLFTWGALIVLSCMLAVLFGEGRN